MKYIIMGLTLLLLMGCESKTETQEKQNRIENILIDEAAIVDNDTLMTQYRDFNQHLLDSFDIDFRTITTTNDEDIDLYANREFTRLQQESRSHSGKAILMVINTIQDKVRLEVSMALESVYTDAFVSYIERKGFVPYFRDSKIADGIYMAAELISDRAYEATAGKAFMPPMQSKSIGAGAKTAALIGQTDTHAKQGSRVNVSTGNTPVEVLQKYLKVLKAHNTNPELDIYTDTTKAFFKKWTVTEINQNNEIRFLTPCMDSKQVKYASDGIHAVLMNDPIDQRKCTPHFFKKEQGHWKLDIATMAQILRFNTTMQWHFDTKVRLKGEAMYYAFAFDGYGLDKNGYPFTVDHPKPNDARWGYKCGAWYLPKDHKKVQENSPDTKKYIKCWINMVWNGSPADIRLGLDVYDQIYAIGEGSNRINNVSYTDFMDYMADQASGEKTTVVIRRKSGEEIVRQGIAP
jgi:uncharacterized protein